MRRPATRRFIALVTAVLFCVATTAQPEDEPSKKDSKPYRILTSGKQFTVKSRKNIKNIMVWTSSGHRIVEQRGLNAPTFSFQPAAREKVYFVMIQYEGQKPFTEKIGLP